MSVNMSIIQTKSSSFFHHSELKEITSFSMMSFAIHVIQCWGIFVQSWLSTTDKSTNLQLIWFISSFDLLYLALTFDLKVILNLYRPILSLDKQSYVQLWPSICFCFMKPCIWHENKAKGQTSVLKQLEIQVCEKVRYNLITQSGTGTFVVHNHN